MPLPDLRHAFARPRPDVGCAACGRPVEAGSRVDVDGHVPTVLVEAPDRGPRRRARLCTACTALGVGCLSDAEAGLPTHRGCAHLAEDRPERTDDP